MSSKKKRIISVIFSFCLTTFCVGCGYAAADAAPDAADLTFNRRHEMVMIPEIPVSREEETAQETPGAGQGVYFGSEHASGSKDFKYLTEKSLITAKTDSRQEAEIPVYVPNGEKAYASGASAKGEYAGVSVKVDLEPYVQYKQEDYTVSSNLEKYVEGEIDYHYENYFDLEVTAIEELSKDAASCEMNFMKYDALEDTYAPFVVVYSLQKIDDEILALVVVTIDADNTTSETDSLLQELSSFYRVPLGWDSSFAEIKRAKFENTGQSVDGVFYLDGLSFELPDGWEFDEAASGYGSTFYAPDGDFDNADTGICLMEVMEAFGLIEYMLEDAEGTLQMLGEMEGVQDLEMKDVGFTFLGRTLCFSMKEYEDDKLYSVIMIYAEDDRNQYSMIATSLLEENGEEMTQPDEEMREALELFFETGRVRNVL